MTSNSSPAGAIAIVGLACRLPGAANPTAFWRNLCAGVEAITTFSDEALLAAGVDSATLADPAYVKAGTVLEDCDRFDAAFFGYTPREAEILDPQQRLFLECAWEALESAGVDPARPAGPIGVFAGSGLSQYLLYHLLPRPELMRAQGEFQVFNANDKDFLATRTSYDLDLRGPSLSINTACSTSLVAIHVACQSLLNFECDLALAGGVSLSNFGPAGYNHVPGSILAPDGRCRPFDAEAHGTVASNGAGVVALKRLVDALDAGDPIVAVIRGTAINNDGAAKVGFTAPSVSGQSAVIAQALANADVPAETITYVEAHGTGTELGDPIEITALAEALGGRSADASACVIGSVKSNLGHLDAAAGVIGLIKTALMLQHGELVPSLNFETPNPRLDLASGPFVVNTTHRPWPGGAGPRRAGVSSFGIGGTNAHAVLEEAPARAEPGPTRARQLLVWSAKSQAALATATGRLADHLATGADLADTAYTLALGRHAFELRRFAVCAGASEGEKILRDPAGPTAGTAPERARPIVFMFPGQGAQHVDMGRALYDTEPIYRAAFDQCAGLARPALGVDLTALVYPEKAQAAEAAHRLKQTLLAQPALFSVAYALAQLWLSWGLQPAAMIGHSIGEYVAACLANVFSVRDALTLVAARGRLMQDLPAGSMLAVSLSAAQARGAIAEAGLTDVAVAAANGPALAVVSGPTDSVARLEADLTARGVAVRALHTSHAFHSAMLDPILAEYRAQVVATPRRAPERPYVSNLSGTWITAEDVLDPDYWVRHLRETVNFADGIGTLLAEGEPIFLEVGPGGSLATFVRQAAPGAGSRILQTLPHVQDPRPADEHLLTTLGRLWAQGAPVDWEAFYADGHRRKVALPTYAFDRQRYWIDPPASTPKAIDRDVDAPQPAATFYARPVLATDFAAPRDELETRIAGIWADLLGIGSIGIHDNFFELGGHSLLGTVLLSRLREAYQVDVPLKTLFEAPTVSGLAQAVTQGIVAQADGDVLAALLAELETQNDDGQ